ncbi:hypothetical protein GCM10009039_03840 [Halocalculus aciditolerans]|uniref:Uncharacterized protein n=1 Tax=Halocalculus aciditolerans TaxID=1383812 RepID=A0A830F7R0_9EURY|nr:hypothetical protein GCM10009039_03840 [Halocalculus aciditolerans]
MSRRASEKERAFGDVVYLNESVFRERAFGDVVHLNESVFRERAFGNIGRMSVGGESVRDYS